MNKILLTFFLLLFILNKPVFADTEMWNFFENRLPVSEKKDNFPSTNLRVFTGSLINQRSQGLGDLLLRVGPLVDFTPWMFVGLHGVLMADRTTTGDFMQENRLELEPNFYGRIGDFILLDRNRLEFRSRTTGNQLLYRNMIRVNYAPKGQLVSYFISEEPIFDMLKGYLVQNRAIAGITFNINKNLKLDAGYMLKTRYVQSSSSWQNDHVLITILIADFTK